MVNRGLLKNMKKFSPKSVGIYCKFNGHNLVLVKDQSDGQHDSSESGFVFQVRLILHLTLQCIGMCFTATKVLF